MSAASFEFEAADYASAAPAVHAEISSCSCAAVAVAQTASGYACRMAHLAVAACTLLPLLPVPQQRSVPNSKFSLLCDSSSCVQASQSVEHHIGPPNHRKLNTTPMETCPRSREYVSVFTQRRGGTMVQNSSSAVPNSKKINHFTSSLQRQNYKSTKNLSITGYAPNPPRNLSKGRLGGGFKHRKSRSTHRTRSFCSSTSRNWSSKSNQQDHHNHPIRAQTVPTQMSITSILPEFPALPHKSQSAWYPESHLDSTQDSMLKLALSNSSRSIAPQMPLLGQSPSEFLLPFDEEHVGYGAHMELAAWSDVPNDTRCHGIESSGRLELYGTAMCVPLV